MQSGNPASPLYWIEVVGKRALKLADDSLEFGSLTNADAEHMRHLRREMEYFLGQLLAHLYGACQTNSDIALPVALCVSKLMENSLGIGLIAPAASESAKAAIVAARQRVNAKKDRTDSLQALIVEIMERKPAIKLNDLLAELRRCEHKGVVETINDAEKLVEWTGKRGQVGSTPFSALKDRMSRARKNLRSR